MIRTIFREFFSLFIDDRWFAAALILWCACCGVVLPYFSVMQDLLAPVLFVGCIVILSVNVLLTAARRRP